MRGGNADVIHQRIEPDVSDEILVKGQGNAPVQSRCRAGNAQIFEFIIPEKPEDFIAAMVRRDKCWIFFDVINQPLLLLVQFEEVILFLQLNDFSITGIEGPIRTAILLGQECFLLRRVKTLVGFFIDLTGFVNLREAGLNDFLVARFGGADEIVVGQFQLFRKGLPILCEFIAIRLRCLALGNRGLLDFLAMFIEAGEEEDLLSQTASRPRDDVSRDFLVSMAEMRLAIDIINRGGDEKPFAHAKSSVKDRCNIGNYVVRSSLRKGLFKAKNWLAVAENQPDKNRMKPELSNFAARLLPRLRDTARQAQDNELNQLALELFALQFKYNSAYRVICEARKRTPDIVEHWTQIPAVPAAAFKELELTCLAPSERTAVFHSSGTTEQHPSRHFHNAESLVVYEASLWSWFERHIFADSEFRIQNSELLVLTPPPEQAPHSSLVHMFDVVRQKIGGASVPASRAEFLGKIAADGSWTLDFDVIIQKLKAACDKATPMTLLGTAFSFIHLLDFLAENNLRFRLPPGSRVMETGGYKNNSRTMPKSELHALVTRWLGISQSHIICEYGMSELSSQAYDFEIQNSEFRIQNSERRFHFPPWSRVQIISPETNREVANSETGLIRVLDLANVFSIMAIQTEDLGVRHGDGFELIGRAQFAEPRGCSLMSVESK